MASDSKKADTSTDPPRIIDVDEEREEEEEEQPKKKYTSLFIYTCITLNPQEKLIYFQLDFWCPWIQQVTLEFWKWNFWPNHIDANYFVIQYGSIYDKMYTVYIVEYVVYMGESVCDWLLDCNWLDLPVLNEMFTYGFIILLISLYISYQVHPLRYFEIG